MEKIIKYESEPMEKVSATEVRLQQKKITEEVIDKIISLEDLLYLEDSLTKSIQATQESKQAKIREADNSIAALTAQLKDIKEKISEAKSMGVVVAIKADQGEIKGGRVMNNKGQVFEGVLIVAAIIGTLTYVGITEGLPKPNWKNSAVSNPSPHLDYSHLGGKP